MARSGRFGRLPRTAPNLASTIVAMVREVNAQEDANILQAWEEGGLYKGKKVTDAMLIAHFKMRRDSMSPTDPLWDKWNTTVQNYEFAIEESKMSLKYAENKVTDGQMASFYRTWAKKLPVDSEAYRNLMRSAAQFADAAAAKGRSGGGGGGGGGGGDSAAYEAAFLGAYDRYERPYDTSMAVLLQAAYYEGILQQTDTEDPDDLADLRGGDEMDHTQFMRLFDAIQTSDEPFYAWARETLSGVGVTDLTYGAFVELGKSKETGLQTRIGISKQFDDKSGAKDTEKELTEFNLLRAVVGDLDEYQWYQQERRRIDVAIEQGDLSPYELRDLLTEWGENLTRVRDHSFATGGTAELQGFLNSEIRSLNGEERVSPTAYEGNEGGIRNRDTADSLNLSTLLRGAEQVIQLVESRQAVLWQHADEDGRTLYDAITVDDPMLRDGQVLINAVSGISRGGVPTFTQFTPLYGGAATMPDPRTGLPSATVAPMGSQLIGQSATINGKTYYGIYDQGRLTWFSQNPFERDAQVVTNRDGSMTVIRELGEEALTYDPETGDVAGFDTSFLINPRHLLPDDPGHLNPAKHESFMAAVYVNDAIARNALLRATDDQLQMMSVLSSDPEATYAEVRDLRNTVVDRHNAVRAAQRDFGLAGSSLSGRAELMQRLDAGADMEEPTGLTEREKARAKWTIESGRAWQSMYEATTPEAAASGTGRPVREADLARDRSEIGLFAALFPDRGYREGEGLKAYLPTGTTGWAAGKQALPAIKVPEVSGLTPRVPPPTPRRVQAPVTPTAPTARTRPALPLDEPPEPKPVTPKITTPVIKQPVFGIDRPSYTKPVLY